MQLHRFGDIKEFCDRTQAYLLQHEAEHNLLLGITHTLLYFPDRYPNPPYLVTVEAEGDIVAVAMRTPPHKLVLSKVKELTALALFICGKTVYQFRSLVEANRCHLPEESDLSIPLQSIAAKAMQLPVSLR